MKTLIRLAALAALASCASAAATHIADTLYLTDGVTVAKCGRIYIEGYRRDANGKTALTGSVTVYIGPSAVSPSASDGAVDFELEGGTSVSFKATVYLYDPANCKDQRSTYVEPPWVVPITSSTLTIRDIRGAAVPPLYTIPWSQLAQNGASTGWAPVWSGFAWVPIAIPELAGGNTFTGAQTVGTTIIDPVTGVKGPIFACVGTPGNTTGPYGSLCEVRAVGLLYACTNAAGCTVAGDWTLVSGSGGGTTVNVNGSSVSNPNFNESTPAVEANHTAVKFQVSGSDVSAEVAFSTAYSCTVTATGALDCTHNLNTLTPWVVCYDALGRMLGSSGTDAILTGVIATSANVASLTFSDVTTATCVISSGAMGGKGDTGAKGDPGADGLDGTDGAMSDPGADGITTRCGLNTLCRATAHNAASILTCTSAGASGTAYACSTSPTFTPAAKDSIVFCPDVANTGAATLVVNSQSGTPAIQKRQGQAALVANDLRASPAGCTLLTFDGANWQMQGQVGNLLTSNGSPMWTSMSSGGLVANETAYLGVNQVSKASNETSREMVMPMSCTVNNLAVWMADGSTQTSSGSLTVTMRKNEADTTLSCPIPAGAAGHIIACTDTAHPISYVGLADSVSPDRIAVKVKNNSLTTTSTAIQLISWSCQ